MEEVTLKIREEVTPKIMEEVTLKIMEEVTLKIREEVTPKIMEEVTLKIMEEVTPKIREGMALKVREEVTPEVRESHTSTTGPEALFPTPRWVHWVLFPPRTRRPMKNVTVVSMVRICRQLRRAVAAHKR
uniref:Uncharacterized protein n=1 Tax=Rangifer tarandus platyrhynchus TaxID=3082113 RepID=A0ACB0FK05_RANTA|nr:unnamed protein product [Rangifer tarandus platyrhynchus]